MKTISYLRKIMDIVIRMTNLTIFTIFIVTYGLEVLKNDKKDLEIIKIAKDVTKNNCKMCRTLIIYCEENVVTDDFLKDVSIDLRTSFLTVPLYNYSLEQEYISIEEKPNLIIIFLDFNTNISIAIFEIEILSVWTSRANHIFIVNNVNDANYENWLEESFKALWERQVLRAIICFPWKDNIKIYSYNPFTENYNIDLSHKYDENTIFLNYIKNMFGYPIKGYFFDGIYKDTYSKEKKNGKFFYKGFDGKFIGM